MEKALLWFIAPGKGGDIGNIHVSRCIIPDLRERGKFSSLLYTRFGVQKLARHPAPEKDKYCLGRWRSSSVYCFLIK